MATTTVEQEIVDLEKQYWEALRTRDNEAALRLTEDPCIVTGAQGVASLDEKTFREMMKSEQWTLHDFKIQGEPEIQVVNDDVAVIGYKVTEKMTVEGKPLTLEAAEASTWVRRNGRWRCVLHTESILGDPFGRDRQPAKKT